MNSTFLKHLGHVTRDACIPLKARLTESLQQTTEIRYKRKARCLPRAPTPLPRHPFPDQTPRSRPIPNLPHLRWGGHEIILGALRKPHM